MSGPRGHIRAALLTIRPFDGVDNKLPGTARTVALTMAAGEGCPVQTSRCPWFCLGTLLALCFKQDTETVS